MTQRKKTFILTNGLDGATGELFIEPIPADEFGRVVRKKLLKLRTRVLPIYKGTGRLYHQRSFATRWHMPRMEEPEEVKWGVVIHRDDKKLKTLLKPLIEHRSGEVLYYDGNENVEGWINKNLLRKELPYYLMIAGHPSKISFEFQYLLDVRFAVGRICFDNDKGYENYCQAVIEHEKNNGAKTEKRVVMWGTDKGYDDSTYCSRRYMVEPLARLVKKQGYKVKQVTGRRATEVNLRSAVEGEDKNKWPALMYTASHGLAWKAEEPDQRFMQGALCCQNLKKGKAFPGIGPDDELLSGHDVDEGFCAPGVIWFCFACFGAGTPKFSNFAHWVPEAGYEMYQAKEDFVAYLPMRLLGCEKPSLAFIGHVDPAWVHSFMEPTEELPEDWESRLYPFRKAVEEILNGVPVGHAMRKFNENYATLNTRLIHLVEMYELGKRRGEDVREMDTDRLQELTDLWITRTDYQNFIVLGDPAVRVDI